MPRSRNVTKHQAIDPSTAAKTKQIVRKPSERYPSGQISEQQSTSAKSTIPPNFAYTSPDLGSFIPEENDSDDTNDEVVNTADILPHGPVSQFSSLTCSELLTASTDTK